MREFSAWPVLLRSLQRSRRFRSPTMMSVLDGVIRRQLNDLIGQAGDAKVVVKGGNVVIEDCHFDESALEEALFPPVDPQLPPMRLGTVHVKRLAITIPWNNFSKGFLDVEVDGLSVLLYRRQARDVTLEEVRLRKEACVAGLMAELLKALTAMGDKKKRRSSAEGDGAKGKDGGGADGNQQPGGEGAAKQSLLDKMIASAARKILESFRPIIRLTNVHIRYEDLGVNAVAPLALGVTVGRLFLQHPDSPYSEIDEDPDYMPVKDVTSIEVAMRSLEVPSTASISRFSISSGSAAWPLMPTVDASFSDSFRLQ